MIIRPNRWAWVALSTPLLLLSAGCSSEPPPPAAVAKTPEPPKPPPDSDGDGIADDGTDKCLVEKEDGLPPDPADGCKSTDPDGDGLVGDADKCPMEKE